MTSPPNRALLAAHRAALWACRGPLRRPALAAGRTLARSRAALATRGEPVSVYTRGGLGRGDFVAGLSDVDVVVVAATDAGGRGVSSERIRQRWRRSDERAPWAAQLFGEPRVVDDAELSDLVGSSSLTYGLAGGAGIGPAAFSPDPSLRDRLRMLDRPGLYGATDDWRRLSGRERRPREHRDAHANRVAGWLELGFYWRLVFPTLLDPERPRTAFLCVKLVAEPARIWLWLAHGERAGTRRDALLRALHRLPGEEEALRMALTLERSLHRAPAAPVAESLGALARFSSRIATLVGAEAAAEGTTSVRLVGARPAVILSPRRPPGRARPLCDWRALVQPSLADEHVTVGAGALDDPHALRDATLAQDGASYRALRDGDVLVLPASVRERVRLRSVSCPVSDPVSFALLDDRGHALFPNVPGWSIVDVARRALAESRGQLVRGASGAGPERELVVLLGAARAALVAESLGERDPCIPVTLTATAALLGERSSGARAVADDALGALRASPEDADPSSVAAVASLRRLVEELPCYRDEPGRS